MLQSVRSRAFISARVKVATPNGEPIIKADNVRLDCNLFRIFEDAKSGRPFY